MQAKEDNSKTPETLDDHAREDRYAIRIAGHLDARWSTWFDGMSINQESDGTTTIEGAIADQAALHGVLRKISDLGLELVSVTRMQTG